MHPLPRAEVAGKASFGGKKVGGCECTPSPRPSSARLPGRGARAVSKSPALQAPARGALGAKVLPSRSRR